MIDLSMMRSVHVDPSKQIARVDGGATLGRLDRETQVFGLATTAGIITHTGVGGLTLGGGVGRLARKYGLACDNLISVDVVTADGRFLKASASENEDLFLGFARWWREFWYRNVFRISTPCDRYGGAPQCGDLPD